MSTLRTNSNNEPRQVDSAACQAAYWRVHRPMRVTEAGYDVSAPMRSSNERQQDLELTQAVMLTLNSQCPGFIQSNRNEEHLRRQSSSRATSRDIQNEGELGFMRDNMRLLFPGGTTRDHDEHIEPARQDSASNMDKLTGQIGQEREQINHLPNPIRNRFQELRRCIQAQHDRRIMAEQARDEARSRLHEQRHGHNEQIRQEITNRASEARAAAEHRREGARRRIEELHSRLEQVRRERDEFRTPVPETYDEAERQRVLSRNQQRDEIGNQQDEGIGHQQYDLGVMPMRPHQPESHAGAPALQPRAAPTSYPDHTPTFDDFGPVGAEPAYSGIGVLFPGSTPRRTARQVSNPYHPSYDPNGYQDPAMYGTNGPHILTLESRRIIGEDKDEDGHATCKICLENVEIGTKVKLTVCKHWFHSACVGDWLKNRSTCPTCRRDIRGRPQMRVEDYP